MVLAYHGYAPISYWESCTLAELNEWIKQHNKLMDEMKQKKG